MNKLHLELRIVNDQSDQLMTTRVPFETLDSMVKQHGEKAVKDSIWEMFNKLAAELKKQ